MSMVNNVIRRIGFDKAAASGAAALAAACVFLIPAEVLENAVAKAGLDTMFAPLAPPIGAKARIGLALLVAGMVFGTVLSAMSLLDALTRKRPVRASETDAEDEGAPAPPKVRRRDAHPDAPTRAPLSPLRELGLPDPVGAVPEEAPRGRLRRFRPEPVEEAATPIPQVAAPWPEGEPADAAPEPAATEDTFLETPPAAEAETPTVPAADADAFAREPAVSAEPEPVGAEPEPVAVKPEPVAVEPQPRFVERRAGDRRREERTGRETIPELMARLERALGATAEEEPAAEAPVPEPAPAPAAAASSPEPSVEPEAPVRDDRLRSAIEHLRRVASRT